ncbi:type 3 dihydrofolate reductase [Alteromonas sp. 1_MG-2023]|uniref:type 3 dihydrofolate reductase n=1 Tax=Alteromonas sp. 1_MG-2023 TaxID=3062669 RepID=UPI0026E1ABDA|nr:type 3 dihydrofolate reductase [Alteromonas sp. 1_MG-2023]MDO6565799.1 type 3 dihydrofolate reductase [Alteromonas sp. 1_MG-2023]
MIAAMANKRIIGADNDMPWHLPADLKHFKKVTMGKPVIMGRKTYESIGRALPGRPNIVITTNSDYSLPDANVVASPESAIKYASALDNQTDEVMIIGGGTIYQAFLDKADTLHLTYIDLAVEGDTQFPDYEAQGNWKEISREAHSADEKNPHNYTFVSLIRG